MVGLWLWFVRCSASQIETPRIREDLFSVAFGSLLNRQSERSVQYSFERTTSNEATMLQIGPAGSVSGNGLTRTPAACTAVDACECALHPHWVRQCCEAIALYDPSICADDLLDLAVTLWDRPGCQKICPKLVVKSLFADELAGLH